MTEVSRETAEKAAEKILLPGDINYTFLGQEIKLKPLPISVSRDIRRHTDQLSQLMAGTVGQDISSDKFTDIDLEAAEVYIKTAIRILIHYNITVTKEIMENQPLSDIKEFIEKQLEVQGEEDFLLEQLRRTIKIFSERNKRIMNPKEKTT